MCFVVYVSHFFSFSRSSFSLKFPWRENVQICVYYIREGTSSSSVWCASLFVISVSFERECIDFAKRFLLIYSFSFDEQTINRCRRTSSGAKKEHHQKYREAVTTFTTFSSPANEKVDAYKVGDSTNIKWHEGSVDVQTREKTMGQKGCVLWFTGLSGSGRAPWRIR